MELKKLSDFKIESLDQYLSLWKIIYSFTTGPSWDHILPYYDENVYFKDSIQEIRGLANFTEMTRRLSQRSKNIELIIHNSSINENLIFVEWEMLISYKWYPKSSIFGISRTILKEGKIIDQRDYYDLWGDIFDNIKFFAPLYRFLMKRKFG